MSSPADPIAHFQEWLAEARAKENADPTALALATVDSAGLPSVRIVLLKHIDASGLVFYTNLNSPKSVALRANPHAAACFHWPTLRRQVRVEGAVHPVDAAEADVYFSTRPRLSQLGAWASRQSEAMSGRFELLQAVARETLRFAGRAVDRPPHWSGWRIEPKRIEFWREHSFRLHERRLFVREGDGWRASDLFP